MFYGDRYDVTIEIWIATGIDKAIEAMTMDLFIKLGVLIIYLYLHTVDNSVVSVTNEDIFQNSFH